jgi:hypothetical protein
MSASPFTLFLPSLLLATSLGTGAAFAANAPAISVRPIGSYSSPVYQYDQGAAEIVAHDAARQRIFVVNAQAGTIDVLSIADPTVPVKVDTLDIKPFGAVANSVACRDGVVAVAVENPVKTSPGRVVFFGPDLKFLAAVEVGALPDMLTFTPNGRYVLVANEGEPSADYSVDPEGSISVIDVSGNLQTLNPSHVRTADFRRFTRATLDPTVRIFGANQPTVAQDLEPEYITVSHDSRTAWVTLQENNALATVDVVSATVTAVTGLGFKDHAAVEARAETFAFSPTTLPVIGTTLAGQSIRLGGFSGLHFEGIDPVTGRYRFLTHTDRGPNAEPVGIRRPFLLPDFAPEVVRFELDRARGALVLTQRIPLQRAPGQPLSGRPNTKLGANASQAYNDELPVDLLDRELPLDPLGADLEGIVVDPADGSFWMVDEYRPAIYHFSPAGVLVQRYVPIGTAAAAGQPAGTYGVEVLPAVLAQRRQNRGFEAIAWDNGRIYAFVQSPLRNPVSLSNGALNAMTNVRIVEFNPVTRATRQFLYVMDNPNLGGEPNTRADKIGDAVALGRGEFLVVERDDDAAPGDAPSTIEKKVYRFNLNAATDVSAFSGTVGATGKTIEQLTTAELVANGITPVFKMLHVDLNAAGYNRVQKVEGLAVIDRWTLAVINDNDFGVANITVQPNGAFTLNYVPETVQLGVIDVRLNGLDASDADNAINIRQWPVKGVYMPDAIASYRVGGKTYLVTANEGDAREYRANGVDFLNEAARVSSVTLDPTAFPNPAPLRAGGSLGRLNITTTMGRDPTTGAFKELFAFGGRSFSIWSEDGTRVFDSGDELEWLTALAYPARFNASNTSNSFDNRSDDKGPEPEGVALGKAFGREYAFIGLERIGGIVVFDISDPRNPVPVTYSNPRNFSAAPSTPAAGDLGPEGLIFIKAEDSPNGKPLVVVGNEISGSTTIYEVEKLK